MTRKMILLSNIKNIKRYFIHFLLISWVALTLIALAAMYKLWWEREVADYFGKSIQSQRAIVNDRAGLSSEFLNIVKRLDKDWPSGIAYTAEGDHNQLSYGKYLLIPRIPKGSDSYKLLFENQKSPQNEELQGEDTYVRITDSIGFLLSLVAIGGMAFVLKKSAKSQQLSFPEAFACTVVGVMALIVAARAMFHTAVPGFISTTVLGGGSWALILFHLARRKKKQGRVEPIVDLRFPGITWSRWMIVFLGIAFLSVLWSIIMAVIVVPDDWDTWGIWAAKAKVLALGTGPLSDVSFFGHSEYPLLWPSIWGYSGWLSGGWEEVWSRGWGSVFYVLCIWELTIIVYRSTERQTLALMCGVLFASMPVVPLVVSWSYAETPFWFMTICCVGCILQSRSSMGLCVMFVPCLLAAGAAYTKNEGVLFALLLVFWIPLIRDKQRLMSVLVFAAMFLLLYSPWYYWTKIVLGFGSHATEGLQFDMGNIKRSIGRIEPALEMIGRIWLDIKLWNAVLVGSLISTLLAIIKKDLGFFRMLILPIGMLLGYFIVIIFHHAEIYWQVGTSWNRLTLHAMPFIILALALYADKSGSLERIIGR